MTLRSSVIEIPDHRTPGTIRAAPATVACRVSAPLSLPCISIARFPNVSASRRSRPPDVSADYPVTALEMHRVISVYGARVGSIIAANGGCQGSWQLTRLLRPVHYVENTAQPGSPHQSDETAQALTVQKLWS